MSEAERERVSEAIDDYAERAEQAEEEQARRESESLLRQQVRE